MMRISHPRLLAALGIALLAHASSAQAQSGPRWQAWLGCWSAVTTGSSSSTQPSPMLCVTPTNDPDVAEISAVTDGKIVSRDKLDASGRAQTIDAGGCTGTTTSIWSADQRRVFLHSAVSCSGQQSETSAILAMANTNGGEWIDVRSVSAGGNSEVRVARYRDAGLYSGIPSDIAAALSDRGMAVRAARLASTAQIGVRDVIEAARSADPAIVEAWLAENGQRYDIDSRALRELADAGVPGRVTDAMVSVSRSYASEERSVAVYDPWGYGAAYRPAYPVARYRHAYGYAPVGFSFSLFGFGYAPYGYAYAPFGYYPYAYRPVAYVPFGIGYGFGSAYHGSSRRPVVVVRPSRPQYENENRFARPRVERDQGYRAQWAPRREQAPSRPAPPPASRGGEQRRTAHSH